MTTNLPQQALYSAVTRAVSGALSMGASLSHHCDPACSPINMGNLSSNDIFLQYSVLHNGRELQ